MKVVAWKPVGSGVTSMHFDLNEILCFFYLFYFGGGGKIRLMLRKESWKFYISELVSHINNWLVIRTGVQVLMFGMK